MYWTGGSYLGLGTAASMLTCQVNTSLPRPPNAVRALVVLDVSVSIAFSAQSLMLISDSREAVAEDLMLHARMGPISASLLDESEQVFGALRLHDVFDACVRDGLLVHVDARRVLGLERCASTATEKGWLLGNEALWTSWDLRVCAALSSKQIKIYTQTFSRCRFIMG